ncbi:MAG: lysophospholipase [Rhodobacteraceae bacterium]|nr:lysophospholipase [Paracoccaceae bacterium]MCW9043513.1 lysophospholipase [Pseudopelagicola sp.]
MRALLRLAALVLGLGLATVALGTMAERWMLYPFDATHVSPADAGLSGITEVRFENDGEILIAWTAPPRPGKPVLLYFHGNAGNLAVRAGRFRRFLDRGYGLFAPAYRGSSGSSGTPDEAALMSDAAAAWNMATRRFPNAPILLYGESLGAAVALSLSERPAAVILEAPFTSIADLAAHHAPGTRALASRLDNQWPSLTRAARLAAPLLVIHGSDDTLIPIEMGQQITSAAPSREKSLFRVKGAGHTDLWRTDTLPRLWRFVDQFALR